MVAPLFDRTLFFRLLEFMQSLLSGRATFKEPNTAVIIIYFIVARDVKDELSIAKQNPLKTVGAV